jgi:hypothetical protein
MGICRYGKNRNTTADLHLLLASPCGKRLMLRHSKLILPHSCWLSEGVAHAKNEFLVPPWIYFRLDDTVGESGTIQYCTVLRKRLHFIITGKSIIFFSYRTVDAP